MISKLTYTNILDERYIKHKISKLLFHDLDGKTNKYMSETFQLKPKDFIYWHQYPCRFLPKDMRNINRGWKKHKR